jgi:hypothetical protein
MVASGGQGACRMSDDFRLERLRARRADLVFRGA